MNLEEKFDELIKKSNRYMQWGNIQLTGNRAVQNDNTIVMRLQDIMDFKKILKYYDEKNDFVEILGGNENDFRRIG